MRNHVYNWSGNICYICELCGENDGSRWQIDARICSTVTNGEDMQRMLLDYWLSGTRGSVSCHFFSSLFLWLSAWMRKCIVTSLSHRMNTRNFRTERLQPRARQLSERNWRFEVTKCICYARMFRIQIIRRTHASCQPLMHPPIDTHPLGRCGLHWFYRYPDGHESSNVHSQTSDWWRILRQR